MSKFLGNVSKFLVLGVVEHQSLHYSAEAVGTKKQKVSNLSHLKVCGILTRVGMVLKGELGEIEVGEEPRMFVVLQHK